MAVLEFQGLIPCEITLPESPRHMEVETFQYSPSPERFADFLPDTMAGLSGWVLQREGG